MCVCGGGRGASCPRKVMLLRGVAVVWDQSINDCFILCPITLR